MPERISLCIIAGNEAAHIERMLDSFSAGFDELSLVLALGTQPPDNTDALARAWCERHGKEIVVGRYTNGPGNAWPHVDNFAAARNASYAQATGDWLVWADCDDVIDDASQIRALAASGAADLYRCPYSVPPGKLTLRERILRADLFRRGRIWRWPVHENLLVYSGDRVERAAAPTWSHRPAGPKAGGEKRNLRILTHALCDAPTNYYYCHQENFHLRNTESARRFGELFLKLPMRAKPLEYQCLINLSELADTKQEATGYALRAHQLYPRQKEAVAALVKCSFQEENADSALHWSKILIELPEPPAESRLWCYEPKWEGWAAWDLRARALRYAGHPAQAREAQARVHGGRPVEFSLLHATRGRFNRAIQCREMWLDLADAPEAIEHIFAYDDDDPDSDRWLRSFAHLKCSRRTCVAAWNCAAARSSGRVLIQLSDDWQPPRGWDTRLRATYAGRDPVIDPFVVAVSDGTRRDSLLCMAILSRARWAAQGFEVFSDEYEGVYSDNEFTHRAYRDRVVIEARDIVFTHHHPAFGKGEMDETYRRQNDPERYKRGLRTFRRRNPDAREVA